MILQRHGVVIIPEPSEDHLTPVQVADAVFARLPEPGDDRAMARLADAEYVPELIAAERRRYPPVDMISAAAVVLPAPFGPAKPLSDRSTG